MTPQPPTCPVCSVRLRSPVWRALWEPLAAVLSVGESSEPPHVSMKTIDTCSEACGRVLWAWQRLKADALVRR